MPQTPTEQQIAALRRAARNGPRDGKAQFVLANALMIAGRFDAAAEASGGAGLNP